MNITGLASFALILIFLGLIIILAVAGRNRAGIEMREISAFIKIRRAMELAVEAGSRLHISLGRGSITGPESASAFVGLSMLEQMSSSASTGDSPPVVTTGDPTLSILAQDTLKNAYQDLGLIDQFDPSLSQLTGLSPFSFAAGTIPIIRDKHSSNSVLIGNYGVEVGLLTDGCERSSTMSMAGSDDLAGQAVLYATADEPLIGEELYAGGAYLNADPIHTASLQAQDVIRWLLVAVILLGILLKILSLDHIITNLFGGLL